MKKIICHYIFLYSHLERYIPISMKALGPLAANTGLNSIQKEHFNFISYIFKIYFTAYCKMNNQGFLLRQLWIVNYYIKCLSNNLIGVFREMIFWTYIVHFGILIHFLSWNIYFSLLRRKKWTINNFLTNIWHNNLG